jgi:hypothetical protein
MHAQEISAWRFVELCLGVVISEIIILLHAHTHTILSQNFTNKFFFTPFAVHTRYFSCVAVTNWDWPTFVECSSVYQPTTQYPYFFIFAVPNQFRYPVWGQEPRSLTYRHRRLLTQKLKFSPAYYFTRPDYLHTSLFIPTYQTAVGFMSPVEIAKEATTSSISYGTIMTSKRSQYFLCLFVSNGMHPVYITFQTLAL